MNLILYLSTKITNLCFAFLYTKIICIILIILNIIYSSYLCSRGFKYINTGAVCENKINFCEPTPYRLLNIIQYNAESVKSFSADNGAELKSI